jgi:putative photosynthetic complex assembly protein
MFLASATGDRHAQAERDRRAMIPLLRGVGGFVAFTLVLVTVARLTGMTPAATPDDTVPVVRERMIQIMGKLDGSAKVADETGEIFLELGPLEGGFVNGVYRALERIRMLNEIEGNPPIRLVRFADGRLSLRDPVTGWRAELIGFGDTNRDAFAALLDE